MAVIVHNARVVNVEFSLKEIRLLWHGSFLARARERALSYIPPLRPHAGGLHAEA